MDVQKNANKKADLGILNNLQNKLKHIFEKYRNEKNIEIEIRFGWFDRIKKKFNSDIHEKYYGLLKNMFDNSSIWDRTKNTQTKEYITKSGYRVIFDNKGKKLQTFKKVKLENIDVYVSHSPFDIRISICKETPLFHKENLWTHVRHKNRDSYSYKMWSYDLTKVYVPTEYIRDPYIDTNYTYEFEIEYKPVYTTSDSNYLSTSICMKIKDMLSIEDKNHLKNIVLC